MIRAIRGAALPAVLISFGLTFATLPLAPAHAASQVEFRAKKLNAEQLLKKQGQAVQFILKNFKALPKEQRGKSAPFLKALSNTAKQLKEVRKAAASKDSKAFAAKLPELAAAVAQVDATFKLSGIKDKKVKLGVKTLDKAWNAYLKRVKGGKAPNAKELATKNGRRIHDMQKRLDKMAANKNMTKRQKREIERLQGLLRKALAASKHGNQQWYATVLIADFEGYYAGYYYWYAAYDPQHYQFYRDSWDYFSTSTEYFYSESYSYYEEYSWASYEESVETSESYDFEYTSEEYQSFESEYESSEETLDTATEEEYSATDEDKAIEAADDYDSNEAVDDAADNPDQEADAASDLSDDQSDAADAADEDSSYLDDNSNEEASADNNADDSTANDGDQDDNAAADDAGDENANADDGSDDAGMDNNADGDESAADDSSGDDNSADDGGGDDNGGDDGGSDDGGDEQ